MTETFKSGEYLELLVNMEIWKKKVAPTNQILCKTLQPFIVAFLTISGFPQNQFLSTLLRLDRSGRCFDVNWEIRNHCLQLRAGRALESARTIGSTNLRLNLGEFPANESRPMSQRQGRGWGVALMMRICCLFFQC